MAEIDPALKMQIAKRASEMMINTLDAAGVPRDVQIDAVLLTLGILFVRNFKPEHVMSVFGSCIKKLRQDLVTTLAQQKAKKNARH